MINRTEVSCGARQLSHLYYDTPDVLVREVAYDRFNNGEDYVFVIFSDTMDDGNGTRLARYIEAKKLGTVTLTPIRENPNTGNRIRIFLWGINHKALKKWFNNK